MPDQEVISPNDTLNKLSQALIQISRGDPFVALRAEIQMQFRAMDARFAAIDKATELQHEDMVRVPTQVDKAVTAVRDVLEQRILTLFAASDQRLAAMDKATELQHQDMVRVPTMLDKAVGSLQALLEQMMATGFSKIEGELRTHKSETAEKFAGVGAQFSERDTRTDQRAGDTKLAVDAAFAAAKEATAKIEAGFTKQIDGMVEIINTKTENLTSSIGDLKDRVVALESRSGTTMEIRKDSRDFMGLIIGGIALLVAIGALFLKTVGVP